MVTVNLGMLHYILDHVYGAFVHRTKISPPFFSRGWGDNKLDMLERMVKQLFPGTLCENWPPPKSINPIWTTIWENEKSSLREGVFRTSCDEQLLSALPPESHTARVAFLMPKSVDSKDIACVVHLAGTGDRTFERRLRLGAPLLKENIATMVLESPFYGQRRPVLQQGSKLLCVSDLLIQGKATIEEARSLLYWLEHCGFGKLGVCGLSMGGVHAAMVGSMHPTAISTLPFLTPHSAVVPFCEGILKYGTAWEALRNDTATSETVMTLEEVRERMKRVLSLTDITRFPVPKNPNAVIFVSATDDGYIPKHSVLEFKRAWPRTEVRWVTGGHVSSFLLHNGAFRRAIVDGLHRLQPPLR